MKKNRLLVAILLAMTMVLSALAFTACNDGTTHTCGHVCPTCSKCTSDCTDEKCKDKCEGHTPAAVDMTEGVYEKAMEKYTLLIKFYDANTYYLQNEEQGFRGKYEIKDEEITFTRSQADGTDYNSEEHPTEARWETGNKVIYFYQEDGVTPIDYVLNSSEQSAHSDTIIKGTCYAYGTKSHVLAYNTETDKIQSLKGKYGSRTLDHSKDNAFGVSDEKTIEQAKFMVKDLPADAEEGKVKSDYFFTLSQKGYETNIEEIRNLGIKNGLFTKTADGYSLTDTLSGATATLKVTQSGAILTKGNATIELVTWELVEPNAPGTVTTLKELTATANLGVEVTFTLAMKSDCTFIVTNSMNQAAFNITGKWTLTTSGTPSVTFSEVNNGTFTFALTQNATFTWTGTLGQAGEKTLTFTMPATDLSALQGAKPVTTLKELTATANLGVEVTFTLAMKSDGTFIVTNSMNQAAFNITGKWTLTTSGTPSVTFSEVNNGTFTFALTQNATFTWTGTLGQAGEKTLTFTMLATDLSALQGAKPTVTTKKELTATANLGVEVTFILALKSDGTFVVTNSMNQAAFNITGKWTLTTSGTPSVTFSEVNNGTFTFTLAQNATFTWTGTLGQAGEKTLTFTMPATDLSALQ